MASRRAPRTATVEAPTPTVEPTPRLFTVDEYYKMAEVGILRPDEKVQLVEGIIVQMPAICPRHAFNVGRVTRLLGGRLGERAEIRTQNPIHLSDGSEPEPDVALVQPHADESRTYEKRHPTPEETFLVVEIADSTLSFDLGTKAASYARHGVGELWVIDLQGHVLVVHREPTAEGYARFDTLARGDSISPLAFPDVTFTVDEVLG